jgi:hypothetical protein
VQFFLARAVLEEKKEETHPATSSMKRSVRLFLTTSVVTCWLSP